MSATQSKDRKIVSFMNSPFCVTLLGGALAAGVSQWWQYESARVAYNRTVLESALKERRSTARDFADSFGSALYYYNILLVHHLWLHPNETKEIFPDGRDFVSERAYYGELEMKVFSHATPESLAARVLAVFSSTAAQSRASQLTTTVTRMVKDGDEGTLRRDFGSANTEYEALISDMTREISAVEAGRGLVR
jgi:hypothetical protein